MTTPLDDIFNIEPHETSRGIGSRTRTDVAKVPTPADPVVSHGNIDANIDSDYELTRANLRWLIENGQTALETALEVARESEQPRAFEAVGNLVKQLAEVNFQLLNLSDKRQKLGLGGKPDTDLSQGGANVTNNAFFVGSTNELSKLIKGLNNKIIVDPDQSA